MNGRAKLDVPDHCLDVNVCRQERQARQTLESLIQLSVPLFIVAATISRFIGDPGGDPHDRLATFLHHLNTGQMTKMEQCACRFRSCKKNILYLQNPILVLPVCSLVVEAKFPGSDFGSYTVNRTALV